MTDVVKRNGMKEQFKEEKVRMSIEGAVKDAGFDVGQKREVIDHAAQDATQMARGMDQIEVKQLRDTILRDLEQDDQQVAQAVEKLRKNTWNEVLNSIYFLLFFRFTIKISFYEFLKLYYFFIIIKNT